MDLRTKLLLGIGLAFIVAFTLVALFSVISMQASYRALEDYEVRHAVGTTVSAMETDLKNTYSTARDYSAWTATYRFARGENPGWIDENMGGDFFSRFTLDHVLVFDRTGRLLFSMQYNTSSQEIEPVPDTLVEEIRTLSEEERLLARANGSYGILDTADGPLLIASHPILTDTYEGPAAGSVHIARRLDDRYLDYLSTREGYAITIIPARELQGNASFAGVVSRFASGDPVAVREDNGNQVSGYVPLGDLTSSGRYYLRVTLPRTISAAGQENIALFLVSLAGAGVFIIFFVLLFVDRIILSRLNAITRAIREKKNAGDLPPASTPNGGDELTRLALAIDPVFAQLAESRDKLAESEERYRTLAESARDLIYIVGRDDTVLYVNTFAAHAVGRSRDGIVGKPRSALFTGPEGGRQRENIEKVLSTGLPVKIESNIPLPTGDSWQDTLLVPIRDRNGAITGVMGISRDITQRKAAEEALHASSERFRTVMDSLDSLVYVADMKTGEILFLNRTGQRIWGDCSGRVCWKTIQEGQTGPCPFCTNNRLLDANGKPAGIVVWEYHNRHNGRWYECRDRAIEWTDGRYVRLEIASDITDRKRAEEALSNVNKKLNLLSSITRHDILNQLTALAAYLDLSLEHAGNDTMKDFIHKEQKIATIIDREINFTRDYQDLGVRAPVWHDARETIGAAARSLLPGSVKIEVKFSDIWIFADPLLEKVFFNLIDNALRYGGETLSAIRFSAGTEGKTLVITCEDDGVGIPAENKEHIFERGFGNHTGLGLFLSREILGITDITIAETGTPGTGARFEIRVPEGTYRFGNTGPEEHSGTR